MIICIPSGSLSIKTEQPEVNKELPAYVLVTVDTFIPYTVYSNSYIRGPPSLVNMTYAQSAPPGLLKVG